MIVDTAIIAVLGLFVWRGARRGLIGTLAGFAGFLVAVTLAVLGYRGLAVVLEAAFGFSEGVANLTGALVIFLTVTLGSAFAARALTRALRWTKWGALNAVAGGALSGAWALTLVTVVLLAVNVIPQSAGVERRLESSAIARGVTEAAPGWLDTIARTDFRSMPRLFQPELRAVAIRASVDFTAVPDAERRLFELANRERRARRLPVLRWDAGLAKAARAHAAAMYREGFFSHISPAGASARDRLRLVGVRYGLAGENLVLAPSAAGAHAILMASPRHRAHIIEPEYRRVGIGVMFGPQGLLVTQDFAD